MSYPQTPAPDAYLDARYYVVNTETGADIAGPFGTLTAAKAEMYRLFPLIDPWDGDDVPVAIDQR